MTGVQTCALPILQTLGAIAHIDYNDSGAMSYERTTHTMYQLGIGVSENKQFFRRMVFNVMVRNQDDHVKNISFLMDKKGSWSLSPAYDITYSYNPKGKWTAKHQMTINSKRENILREDLLFAASSMKIKEKEAVIVIEEVRNSVLRWETFAQTAYIDKKEIEMIKKEFLLL